MGGLVVPAVFERLPQITLEVMYGELDGTFPNHPADPLQPANQRDLQARVVSGGFDVGLAFDGDADRVFVVDEQGIGISGSATTALVAAGVLEKEPGATILHNLICSKAVPEVVRERGGTPIRTKVGHSYIKAEMAATGAAFGGEHSAHYYFRDNYRADSGLIAAMHVLERRCLDDQAQPVPGSTTTAMLAASILRRHPGEQVVHNLICSKAVPEIVTEKGGTPIRTKVGHSFIKEVMASTGAILGGEHSAHYYFRDNYRADSGIIAALVVLEQLSVAGVSLSELRAPFERYGASGEINTKVDDTDVVIERVAAHYADATQDRMDGLTVDCGDWWFNLRASNTEPLLRLNLEAADEVACAERVAEVQAVMAG
jgi:phosphomannomutase